MHKDFGSRLREARERKGISLRQIAAATKISAAALEGLERNDISKLPGGIFSRAFVRSYAIEVGLDPDETLKQFLEQFSGAPSTAPQTAPPVRAPAVPRYVPPVPNVREEVDFESKQKMASVVLKLVLVSLPIAGAIIYFSTRSARPQAQGSPQPSTSKPAVAETSVAASAAVEQAVTAVQAGERDTAGDDDQEPAVPAARQADAPLVIEIAASADCWVKFTTDDEGSFSRVMAAGERETRRVRGAAVLQVGDAAACQLTINGRPARPLGRAHQVREIDITRDNYESLLQ